MSPLEPIFSYQSVYLGKTLINIEATIAFGGAILMAVIIIALECFCVNTQNVYLQQHIAISFVSTGSYLLYVSYNLRYKLKKKVKALKKLEIARPEKQARYEALLANYDQWTHAILVLGAYIVPFLTFALQVDCYFVMLCIALVAYEGRSPVEDFILMYQESELKCAQEAKIMKKWEKFGSWLQKEDAKLQDPEGLITAYRKFKATQGLDISKFVVNAQ